MKPPRHDCKDCHGTGVTRYQKPGEKLGRDGMAEKRPCMCKLREDVPLAGKVGRRMTGIPTAEYRGRDASPVREMTKAQKRAWRQN